MTVEDWAQLKHWFGEALSANEDERARMLDHLRRQSPELESELRSLLDSHDSHSLATQDLNLRVSAVPVPEMFPDGLPPGSPMGPYRTLRELGRGGAGMVFLAERADDEFHRPVALKLLRFALPHAEAGAGLTLERGSLARLHHGNIAILLDWGTSEEGVPWLATEYVEGMPIDEYCRSRQLPEPAVLELFAQVTGAVRYAHRRGVMHRDLKPGNILVNQEGVAKLLDFGISQLVESGPDQAVARRFTPVYASPEQLAGKPATPASDVYSLGVMLGQLLSGALPPDFSRISPGLSSILHHAVEMDAARRYPSVEAFQSDLDRYRQCRPPQGFPVSWSRRARLFGRRHRTGLSSGLLAAGVAAGLGLWLWKLLMPPVSPRPQPAISFMGQPVGVSATLPMRTTWPRGAQVGSVAVVTEGVPNLDFTSPDAAACTGNFLPGASCVMQIRFSPTATDRRMGAVLFRDPRGRLIRTRFIFGVGTGREDWLPAAKPVRLISGLNYARGLSADSRGNAYFIEARGNSLDEIPAGTAMVRVLARMPLPLLGGATAIDGAGVLYFSSAAGHAIYRMGRNGVVPVADFPSSVQLDNSLSVDRAGNLYATDDQGGIYMITAGSHQVVRLYPSGQGHRFIAMDSDVDGTLYCLDYSSDTLDQLSPGSPRLVALMGPDGHLKQPHAVLATAGGVLLVGNDIPNAHLLRYVIPSLRAQVLPALGNQSIALANGSRLFTVVNNTQIYVYPMVPPPKR